MSLTVTGAGELFGMAAQAVYRCFGTDGQLLYIGTTGHLGRRLAAHAEKIWFLEVRAITFEWHPDEESALAAERIAIHAEQPKYNIAGRSMPRRPRVVATPGAPTPTDSRLLEDRKVVFAQLIQAATPPGITPQQLREQTRLGRTFIHQALNALRTAGVVRKAGDGLYLPVDGADVLAVMRSSLLPH
jgi:hypothetical protein